MGSFSKKSHKVPFLLGTDCTNYKDFWWICSLLMSSLRGITTFNQLPQQPMICVLSKPWCRTDTCTLSEFPKGLCLHVVSFFCWYHSFNWNCMTVCISFKTLMTNQFCLNEPMVAIRLTSTSKPVNRSIHLRIKVAGFAFD